MERWKPHRGLTPWRPLRELDELQRYLEDVLGRQFMPKAWQPILKEIEWPPPIEAYEKGNKFIIKAEIPGMRGQDIDVSITDDTLTIKGKRELPKDAKQEDYYCCERPYGTFVRPIPLPPNVDTKDVEAVYDDGILEITLPKTQKIKATKVSVKAKGKPHAREEK